MSEQKTSLDDLARRLSDARKKEGLHVSDPLLSSKDAGQFRSHGSAPSLKPESPTSSDEREKAVPLPSDVPSAVSATTESAPEISGVAPQVGPQPDPQPGIGAGPNAHWRPGELMTVSSYYLGMEDEVEVEGMRARNVGPAFVEAMAELDNLEQDPQTLPEETPPEILSPALSKIEDLFVQIAQVDAAPHYGTRFLHQDEVMAALFGEEAWLDYRLQWSRRCVYPVGRHPDVVSGSDLVPDFLPAASALNTSGDQNHPDGFLRAGGPLWRPPRLEQVYPHDLKRLEDLLVLDHGGAFVDIVAPEFNPPPPLTHPWPGDDIEPGRGWYFVNQRLLADGRYMAHTAEEAAAPWAFDHFGDVPFGYDGFMSIADRDPAHPKFEVTRDYLSNAAGPSGHYVPQTALELLGDMFWRPADRPVSMTERLTRCDARREMFERVIDTLIMSISRANELDAAMVRCLPGYIDFSNWRAKIVKTLAARELLVAGMTMHRRFPLDRRFPDGHAFYADSRIVYAGDSSQGIVPIFPNRHGAWSDNAFFAPAFDHAGSPFSEQFFRDTFRRLRGLAPSVFGESAPNCYGPADLARGLERDRYIAFADVANQAAQIGVATLKQSFGKVNTQAAAELDFWRRGFGRRDIDGDKIDWQNPRRIMNHGLAVALPGEAIDLALFADEPDDLNLRLRERYTREGFATPYHATLDGLEAYERVFGAFAFDEDVGTLRGQPAYAENYRKKAARNKRMLVETKWARVTGRKGSHKRKVETSDIELRPSGMPKLGDEDQNYVAKTGGEKAILTEPYTLKEVPLQQKVLRDAGLFSAFQRERSPNGERALRRNAALDLLGQARAAKITQHPELARIHDELDERRQQKEILDEAEIANFLASLSPAEFTYQELRDWEPWYDDELGRKWPLVLPGDPGKLVRAEEERLPFMSWRDLLARRQRQLADLGWDAEKIAVHLAPAEAFIVKAEALEQAALLGKLENPEGEAIDLERDAPIHLLMGPLPGQDKESQNEQSEEKTSQRKTSQGQSEGVGDEGKVMPPPTRFELREIMIEAVERRATKRHPQGGDPDPMLKPEDLPDTLAAIAAAGVEVDAEQRAIDEAHEADEHLLRYHPERLYDPVPAPLERYSPPLRAKFVRRPEAMAIIAEAQKREANGEKVRVAIPIPPQDRAMKIHHGHSPRRPLDLFMRLLQCRPRPAGDA